MVLRGLAYAGVIMLASVGIACAQSSIQPTATNPRPAPPIRSPADPLRVELDYREAHVSAILQLLRSTAADRQTLTQADIDRLAARTRGARKAELLTAFFMLDLNGNNMLERQERQTPPPEATTSLLVNTMAADTDGDGMISLIEASNFLETPALEHASAAHSTVAIRQLLALDPNKDGKLTVDELEALALASFAKVDKDGDGIVTKQERGAAAHADFMAAPSNPAADLRCTPPKLEANQRLYVVSTRDSGTLSNTSVAGQDMETQTTTIDIADGDHPIYLAVSSQIAMIWRITGRTDRVARLFGSASDGVGVTGIAKDKVTLVNDRPCFFYGGMTPPKASIRRMSELFGNEPEGIVSSHRSDHLSLPDDFMERNSKIAMEGQAPPNFTLEGLRQPTDGKDLEPALTFLQSISPGGIADIDPSQVVSQGRAERYQVLPQQAGMLQLLLDGSIKPIDQNLPGRRRYRVVKEFPRFPAELKSVDFVSFIFPANIKLPEGDPGFSSVTVEPSAAAATP
ncbi:EF-hand domain-containing protein [Endobacterium cereale]|nr:hypothetical protein [Endobacterium cereale]MEB2847106.1 hypothetical protein [Endobacterium cereale]